MIEVQIFPLVSSVALPVAATPTTRSNVPSGYGVQALSAFHSGSGTWVPDQIADLIRPLRHW